MDTLIIWSYTPHASLNSERDLGNPGAGQDGIVKTEPRTKIRELRMVKIKQKRIKFVSEKGKYHMISLLCGVYKKKVQVNLSINRNRVTDVESKLRHTRG